jgi:hypothetical protein
MSIRIKVSSLALAASMLAGAALATAQQAQAREFHLLGGMFDAVVNDALAANRAYYGTGDSRCPLVRTYDRYGNAAGHIHTCMLPPTFTNGVLELRSRRLEMPWMKAEPRTPAHPLG